MAEVLRYGVDENSRIEAARCFHAPAADHCAPEELPEAEAMIRAAIQAYPRQSEEIARGKSIVVRDRGL